MPRVTIDGVDLEVDDRDGCVVWASDWARIDDLGLERRHLGPATYGHVDYYHPAHVAPERTHP